MRLKNTFLVVRWLGKRLQKHFKLSYGYFKNLGSRVSRPSLVAGACSERKKMFLGGSFLKLADDNKYIKNPEAQNRALRGFWENAFFVFLHYRGIGVCWPKIRLNLTSEGLKCPQEVRVQHETCSTICVHLYKLFFTKKNLTGLAGGSKKVKIWPRMGLAFIYFWPRSLLEAPKCVKDPWNTPKIIPPTAPDWFESISRVLDPFRGF